jgi:hypothetical protein
MGTDSTGKQGGKEKKRRGGSEKPERRGKTPSAEPGSKRERDRGK